MISPVVKKEIIVDSDDLITDGIEMFEGMSAALLAHDHFAEDDASGKVEPSTSNIAHTSGHQAGVNFELARDGDFNNHECLLADVDMSDDLASLKFPDENLDVDVIEYPRGRSPVQEPITELVLKPIYDSVKVLNAYKPLQLKKVEHWQLPKGRRYAAETIKRVKGRHSLCYLVESAVFQIFLPSYYNNAKIEPFVANRKFALIKSANPSDRRSQPEYEFYY